MFTPSQRQRVRSAAKRAVDLVSRFYVLAPREWAAMAFEVKTLSNLRPAEIHDEAFAQVVCYQVRRELDNRVLDQHDLYRICVQDHRILAHARRTDAPSLDALLLYVLTHELVHVVRFGQRMQALDLPPALRPVEEACVDRTARLILKSTRDPEIARAVGLIPAPTDGIVIDPGSNAPQ